MNEHLQQQPSNYKRLRRSNLGDYWAKGFLTCGTCGSVLYINGPTKTKSSKNYRCPNCGAAKVDVVHEMIDAWLRSLAETYNAIAQHSDNLDTLPWLVTELLKPHGSVGQYKSIFNRMVQFVLEHQPGDTPEERQLSYFKASFFKGLNHLHEKAEDGPLSHEYKLWSHLFGLGKAEELQQQYAELSAKVRGFQVDVVEELYTETLEKVNQPVREQIEELDRELDKLFSLAFTSDEMKTRCDAKAKELGEQKKTLEGRLKSLVPKYRQAKQALADAVVKAEQLRADVLQAHGENKAVLLAPHLKDVVLHFDATGKRKNDCKLVKVEIHGKDSCIPAKVFDAAECDRLYQHYNGRRRGDRYEWTPEHRASMSARNKNRVMSRDGAGRFAPTSPHAPTAGQRQPVGTGWNPGPGRSEVSPPTVGGQACGRRLEASRQPVAS